MYLEIVPTDSKKTFSEILHETGSTWETYRVRYQKLSDEPRYFPLNGDPERVLTIHEKLVVALSDADAVMMKLALQACDRAHMSVVSEQ
jgi:hypothetical protein